TRLRRGPRARGPTAARASTTPARSGRGGAPRGRVRTWGRRPPQTWWQGRRPPPDRPDGACRSERGGRWRDVAGAEGVPLEAERRVLVDEQVHVGARSQGDAAGTDDEVAQTLGPAT